MTLADSNAAGPADLRPAEPPTARLPVRLGPAAAGRCRRRVHLDADPAAPRALRSVADDGLRLRLSDGDRHRQEVLAALRRALGDHACGDQGPGGQAPGQDASREQAGPSWHPVGAKRPDVVFEPALRSATRFGSPEALFWAGNGYRPVIVRSHRTTDPGSGALTATLHDPLAAEADPQRKARAHAADALALAHYHRLLGDLGLAASPALGGVIGRGGQTVPGGAAVPGGTAVVGGAAVAGGTAAPGRTGVTGVPGDGDAGIIVWHQLDLPGSSVLADYDLRFADRLLVAAAAASGSSLAAPSRIGECRRCSWWPVCSAELAATHDISLIAAGADVDVLHAAGVRTVDDLAGMNGAAAAALPLTGMASGTARARARAWVTGLPLVRRNAEVRVRRADLELDIDMESYLEDGAYLWGTYLTGPAVEPLGLHAGYRAFGSWEPLPHADEGRAFAEFWGYLSTLRSAAAANGLTFAGYCYSKSAEERWLRSTPVRYPAVPGMPTSAEIDEFCASAEWVDIYQEIRDQFVVPGSMKLKALAPVAGFAWRDPEPGGENSMAWYRQAVGKSEPGGTAQVCGEPVDREMANRILRYNEDDVLATLALRTWMTHRAGEVPTVTALDIG